MVKTINIQMDDNEFWDLLEIKKRFSDDDNTMSWKDYILLKRINKKL